MKLLSEPVVCVTCHKQCNICNSPVTVPVTLYLTVTTMHLPIELVQEIVAVLATPDHYLQYGHKRDILHALRQLCLTNHILFDITVPHLYSSIVISTHFELQAFLHTSPALRRRSQSLWLRYFPQMFPLIADLLHDIGPHLRRLALDIPGNELDISIPVRAALQSCTYLEDFTRSGYSPMQLVQPYAFWPSWKALRRLVLDGPLIDDTFIRAIAQLPYLTHLAPIEPRWRYSDDGTEGAAFLRLLKAGQSFQQVLLVYCEASEFYLNSLKRLRAIVKVKGLKEGLDVAYVVMHDKAPAPMNRIRDRIGAGTLWDLDSKNLLGPTPSPDGRMISDVRLAARDVF